MNKDNLILYDCEYHKQFTSKAEYDKALFTLKGLIQGITIDNEITSDEIAELQNWLLVNEALSFYESSATIIETLSNILSNGVVTEEEKLDLLWIADCCCSSGKYYDTITAAIQQLHGVFYGILADDIITDKEIFQLQDWLQHFSFLRGTFPFDDIQLLLSDILADNVITEQERQQLKSFLSDFVDTKTSANIVPENPEVTCTVDSICAKDPEITIDSHVFCFTGKSKNFSRSELANKIEAHNGIFKNNISSKTNYLVLGLDGSETWSYSTYGRKVEKALEIQKQGNFLLIIQENDLIPLFN